MKLFYKNYLLAAFVLLLSFDSYGNVGPNKENRPANGQISTASLRNDCTRGSEPIDQDVNNVRARLGTSGDVWWDGTDGRYIVPKVTPPTPEVSSIFAGSVWLGGFDEGNNLRVAANTYGLSNGDTDFFPGPLDTDGVTNSEICDTWDKYFVVSGADVRQHISNYNAAVAAGEDMNPDEIPESIKGWPGVGNEFFFDIHEFRLPEDKNNGLAGFWDIGSNGELDGEYNPELGDFPIVEIRGCEGYPTTFPDQMIFWIYNDNGNIHTESNSENRIRMEVQVQAFAFATDDEVNNMTFQRYKLINRALEDLTETFFAMWVDGDLGCYTDDYIGCDVDRSLAYYYNADDVDGTNGAVCDGGVPTYGSRVPALGIDYFRGPLDENFYELGMSAFTYYNNAAVGGPWPPGTTDPGNAQEYYNYLSGLWRDGTPFSVGGTGYDPGNPNVTNYAFIDPPTVDGGWSMCEENAPEGDRRTIQASGPFVLQPGTKNELIIGAVWLEELQYPCPNLNPLFEIDDVAQAIFDNCFELTRGPSAPDVDLVELDREIIMILTNEPGNADNNNIHENYAEVDLRAPGPDPEFQYRFEGYEIYQLVSGDATDLDDPDQARLIRQFDIKNGVSTIFNWESSPNPNDPNNAVWSPVLQIEGRDEGIQHTFSITEDQFTTSNDKILLNHKEYYFRVISYGYNNWSPFQVLDNTPLGQRNPYISGDLNIKTTIGVPRPINNLALNSKYGDGIQITRLEGKGNAGRYTELTDATIARLADFGNTSPIEFVYKDGQAPITVKIINPLEVVEGDYELTYSDVNPEDGVLDPESRFILENLTTGVTVNAVKGLDQFYEQVVDEFGISVTAGNVPSIGEEGVSNNGVVGAELEYKDSEGVIWFNGLDGTGNLGEGIPNQAGLNFIQTASMQPDNLADPNQDFSGELMAPNVFNPYKLLRRSDATVYSPASDENLIFQLVRPSSAAGAVDLSTLNNVNIVFTSDKDKWSRCMVLETTTRTMDTDLSLTSIGDVKNFNIRQSPSVTKNGNGTGGAEIDTAEPRMGFGWFPGYAVDVETGERLNIYFGEASGYNCDNFTNIGRPDLCDVLENPNFASDMIWNPSEELILDQDLIQTSVGAALIGGRHNIFVSNTLYDGCESLYDFFDGTNAIVKSNGLKTVTWTASPFARDLLSYEDGLIPNDLTYKLRVSQKVDANPLSEVNNNGNPKYRFTIEGAAAQELSTEDEFNEQLAGISIVPNPYYGYSNYEVRALSTTIKITNLPNECTVNIFSLEGKFIKSYARNVGPNAELAKNGIRGKQEVPNIEWDIKNSKGIPVASGTYLIHVDAPGIGERTLKSFIVQRQFDPSGL